MYVCVGEQCVRIRLVCGVGAVSAVTWPLCVCVCVGTRHTRAFDVEIYNKLKYKDEHGPDFL